MRPAKTLIFIVFSFLLNVPNVIEVVKATTEYRSNIDLAVFILSHVMIVMLDFFMRVKIMVLTGSVLGPLTATLIGYTLII